MRIPNILLCTLLLLSALPAKSADVVRVTPLGEKTGEFCSQDRAMIFEDPTGLRILYDPGTTVAGSADTRLGAVDVVLLTHAHSDHLGNARLAQDPNSSNASCSQAATSPVTATNTGEIINGKSAAFIGSSELGTFLSTKIQTTLGTPVGACPATGLNNETVVPNGTPCTANLGYGAKRTLRKASAATGVRIALVPALHGNALTKSLLADPLSSQLTANGLSIAPGTASGYILTFTNGLSVYLSGDTGVSSDMLNVIRGYYHPELVVFNIGDIFTTGPEEAAFAINELINPATVIPSHANEVATNGGAVLPRTKTARFVKLVRGADVVPPLSGQTMQFDASGHCVSGCRATPASKDF